MTEHSCVRHPDREAYAKIGFLNELRCLECYNALGDFDRKGRLDDKRIKRDVKNND